MNGEHADAWVNKLNFKGGGTGTLNLRAATGLFQGRSKRDARLSHECVCLFLFSMPLFTPVFAKIRPLSYTVLFSSSPRAPQFKVEESAL